MFLCCGRRGATSKDQGQLPPPDNGSRADSATGVIGSAPAPQRAEMDYERARREARETEEKREEYKEGDRDGAVEASNKSLFLTPTLEASAHMEGEDDWAQDLMDSVSKAASTYTAFQSRPCTPAVFVDEYKQDVTPKSPAKEAAEDEKPHNSLYISADMASTFMDYESFNAPAIPAQPKLEARRSDVSTIPDKAMEGLSDRRNCDTSLYITPSAASAFINYDSCLGSGAPPTPAASISDCPDSQHQYVLPPLERTLSPPVSFNFSNYDDCITARRASSISTMSSIASEAATAALDRKALAGNRMSVMSTYSVGSAYSESSSYSTRPSTPAVISTRGVSMRLSMLRMPTRRFSVSSAASEMHDQEKLETILVPITAQLLPKLDKLLSNTSILSNYSRWESAMGLRRDARAFVASGADEYLCEETGHVRDVAGLKKAIDSYVARGSAIQLDGDVDDNRRNSWQIGDRTSALFV